MAFKMPAWQQPWIRVCSELCDSKKIVLKKKNINKFQSKTGL